ncbi:MAG: hypothetical protein IKY44_00385 [Clostridia bacterium]|nr:hypothetical protein [Clostridia bacterium]
MMKRVLIAALAIVIVVSSFLLAGCYDNNGPLPLNPTTPTKDSGETNLYDSQKIESRNNTSSILVPGEEPDYNGNHKLITSYDEYTALDFETWIDADVAVYRDKYSFSYSDDTYWKDYEAELKTTVEKYTDEFFAENNLLLIECCEMYWGAQIEEICFKGNKFSVSIVSHSGFPLPKTYYMFFIPMHKGVSSDIGISYRIYNDFVNESGEALKPIIYLYPETELSVDVTLGYKDKITVSYPEYVDGWSVTAQPDGKLVYNETGRKLYSLYYESENVVDFKVEKDGFVVRGEDVADFLEEKLAILGLNEYEMEEFIIYWLPVLQANEFNYIRFATADEIERNMPLQISGNPDTIIRVLMTYKGLREPIEVTEQQLISPERSGFVAVEWGGTEIV